MSIDLYIIKSHTTKQHTHTHKNTVNMNKTQQDQVPDLLPTLYNYNIHIFIASVCFIFPILPDRNEVGLRGGRKDCGCRACRSRRTHWTHWARRARPAQAPEEVRSVRSVPVEMAGEGCRPCGSTETIGVGATRVQSYLKVCGS